MESCRIRRQAQHDVLMENPPEDKEKKIIICCSRGQISRDIAEELQEQGYEAYSLKGGYVGWLMADMKKKGSR